MIIMQLIVVAVHCLVTKISEIIVKSLIWRWNQRNEAFSVLQEYTVEVKWNE